MSVISSYINIHHYLPSLIMSIHIIVCPFFLYKYTIIVWLIFLYQHTPLAVSSYYISGCWVVCVRPYNCCFLLIWWIKHPNECFSFVCFYLKNEISCLFSSLTKSMVWSIKPKDLPPHQFYIKIFYIFNTFRRTSGEVSKIVKDALFCHRNIKGHGLNVHETSNDMV